MNIQDLMIEAGDPLTMESPWGPETSARVEQLINEALTSSPSNPAAMRRALLALYAHAFIVGRRHAHLGLPLPGTPSPEPLTPDNIATIVAPDDLSGLS
jgi:hypothetical protein